MLKDFLAAKPECDAYLDRIICGSADDEDGTAAIQLLAKSVESPLMRDMYFDRGANAKEEFAWVKASELAETPYAAANALCLAAIHNQNAGSKKLYIRAALREDPDHSLAELMERAIGYGIIDQMNQAIASGAAKARQDYVNARAEDI